MKLDKHVVDMFTELTKPADDVKMEKTCYGTISVVDGTRYVKLDGSDLLVPAASTVKTSHGDRVTVLMKNHSLTVTGNLTAPATDGGGGSSGETGTAATIEVGTVTTGEAGSSASVTNSGTKSEAVFDFVIPRGDKGEKGDTGPQGPQGEKGDTGTWDGTIPEHEHTVSDITDFPTSLPANGGNADTLDGLHANEIAPNPNLLINPDFKINQRGETVWSIGTTHAYFVDRWYSARTNLSLSDDGLMLAWNGTDGSDGWIQEKVETKALFGKTVTISVNANDKIYTIIDTIPETVNASSHKAFTGTPLSISLTNHGGNTFAVALHSTSTTPSLIRGIKCEPGTIATPFVPPDPATELAKCQRYAIQLINGVQATVYRLLTNLISFYYPLPTTLRNTVTSTAEFAIRTGNNVEQSGFTFAFYPKPNGIIIEATKSAHGITLADNPILVVKEVGIFDAEL